MKIKGKHIVMFAVLFVLGFMLSFSYQKTSEKEKAGLLTEEMWEKEYNYKQLLLQQKEANKKVTKDIVAAKKAIEKIEKSLVENRQTFEAGYEELKMLRKLLGEVNVRGNGVTLTINDAKVALPGQEEQYIIHEEHIHMIINELYLAGAQVVMVNDQYVNRFSSIVCTGPVITVDGIQHAVPFTISAIGKSDVLYKSLMLHGGVIDVLKSNNLQVKLDKSTDIQVPALNNKGEEPIE